MATTIVRFLAIVIFCNILHICNFIWRRLLQFLKVYTVHLVYSVSNGSMDQLHFLRLLVKQKHFRIASFSFFCQTSPEYRRIRGKQYFTDHQTAKTIQLFFALKIIFSVLFFFWTSRSDGEFPRDFRCSHLLICMSLK